MDASKIQQELFKVIRASLPPNMSMTEEIAKVLDVSVDSVYRRLRGEKTISLDEVYTLCSHYKISLDTVFNLQTGSFSFQGNLLNRSTFRYAEYQGSITKWMTYFNGFKSKTLYYLCKDIPLFHHFHFREIAAFKYYFWMKTIFHFPEFAKQKFSFDLYPDELFALGGKNLDLYNQIPTVEFWNFDIVIATIRQIEYCKDLQMFHSYEDIYIIYEAFEKLIQHLQDQAALGYKYHYGDPSKKAIGSNQTYYNEVIRGENQILIVLDDMKLSLIPHTTINYMLTRDLAFNENMYNYVHDMIKGSTQISSVSEKERSKFFGKLRASITRRKDALMMENKH